MSTRRRARELACQILYQIDLSRETPERAFAVFWQNFECEPQARGFAEELVRGVWGEHETVDGLIADSAEHWRLGRIAKVDLCILRVATFELLRCAEVPVSVVINEAVEIAKRFGTDDSPGFVNGVLDRVAAGLGRKGEDGREV